MPELAEKRTVTGTACLECNALLTLAASALGTNLPSRILGVGRPLRRLLAERRVERIDDSGVVAIVGSFRVLITVLCWNEPFPELAPRVLEQTSAVEWRGRTVAWHRPPLLDLCQILVTRGR
jgi:hypothetical protein